LVDSHPAHILVAVDTVEVTVVVGTGVATAEVAVTEEAEEVTDASLAA